MKLLLAKTLGQSCFMAILLGAIAIPVGAANLYVATNGNNNNSGTISKPLASIQEAINRAKAGDTIYLRGGVYKPTQQIWMGQSGKANARIVLQSYPGEKATIDGSAIAGTNDDITNVLAIGSQYIDVKGLEVRNSPSVGILTWRAKNIRILNNKVHHTQGTGIGMYESSDMTANGNTVYRSNLANQKRNTPDKAVTSPQDIFANPLFVNGGGFKASDYKLKAASPAIDKGKTLSEVPFDYFGTKRPVNGAYDIGAQEYKSGSANLLLASLGLDADSQTVPEPNNLLGLLFLGGLGLGRFLRRN